MKTKIHSLSVALALSASCRLFAQTNDPPRSWISALPLQAAVCDVIGVGALVSQSATNAIIQVAQSWLGTSGGSMLNVRTDEEESLPTGGTNFVFFLSKYPSFGDLEPAECRYTYIFDMDYHRSRHQPKWLFLLDNNRSWFPVTTDTAAMVTWCSNLVYVSQVNTNLQSFYELIRDGYKNYPESSRIHRDSEYAFQNASYYMPTNFMASVWSDTNLVGWARAWLNMQYQHETRSFLQ
jgi:hypothetical protein